MRPDGRQRVWSEGDYCIKSRHGQYCDRTKELCHPLGYRRTVLPPTPPMSYHSDYTSDSERSSRRRSGIYISERKRLDVPMSRSPRHERHESDERIVYASNSPLSRTLSRTPPRYHNSIPSSPVRDLVYDTYDDTYREDKRERERPKSSHSRPASIKVEIINEPSKGHRRHASSSKTNSSRESNEEERRHRKGPLLEHGDQHRLHKKESQIARQNREIAHRVPVPPTPSSSSHSSSGYRRGSVIVAHPVSVLERSIRDEGKAARKREKEEQKRLEREEEAQKERLKDRFNKRSSYSYYP